MSKIVNTLKAFPVFLVKTLYILPFILFGLWLVTMVYFPDLDPQKYIVSEKPVETDGIFRKILSNTSVVSSSHFHMVDEYVTRKEPKPPVCLTCHGTYPHSKEQKVRSILNFHTGFTACSVCHARNDIRDKGLTFTWVDRNSGLPVEKIEGAYGKYSGRIFPIKNNIDGSKIIFRPVDDESAKEFITLKAQFSPDQIAQAKTKLHEHISPEPILCADCHKIDGYLDFAKLGFSEQRVKHLNSTEVVGMIEKYKTFYMPSVFNLEKEAASIE